MPSQDRFFALAEAPCPRAFLLRPVHRGRFSLLRLVDFVRGRPIKLTLLSEFSWAPVVDVEFIPTPKWMEAMKPLARLTALALSGIAVPLQGAASQEIAEAANFMDQVGKNVPSGIEDEVDRGPKPARWAQGAELRKLTKLLEVVGLAPTYGNMEFVKIDDRWLWVSKNEAEAHKPEQPRVPYFEAK